MKSNQEQLEGEDLIDFLESKLEGIENKLAHSQGNYEDLQNDCLEIQEKLNFQKDKYKRAALMLTEFLEDLLQKKPNILRDQMTSLDASTQQETLDIEKIQQTPIEKLEREYKVKVMFTLLKQLQPFMSANNLQVIAAQQHETRNATSPFDHQMNTISQMGGSQTTRRPVHRSIEMMVQKQQTPKTYRAGQAKHVKNNNFMADDQQ